MAIEKLRQYITDPEIKTIDNLYGYYEFLERSLYIGEIDEFLPQSFHQAVKLWNYLDDKEGLAAHERKPIKVFIESPGGSVVSCLSVIDTMSASKTPIHTIACGEACSAAFFILAMGHKRFAYEHTTLMFHEGSVFMVGMDAGKFRNYAAYYDKLLKRVRKLLIDRNIFSEEEYERIKNDDVWLTAEEAKEKGIIDDIIKEF